MGEKIGYARVSTAGQCLDSQIERLEASGCKREHIFEEKASGGQGKKRPALLEMLRFVRSGDVLVVTKLDRLARSLADLCKTIQQLEDKSVDLVVLDQSIDTTSAMGRFTYQVMGAVAEFERALINERCHEGRTRAQAGGVKFGRKAKLDDDQVATLRDEVAAGEIPKVELARRYGISKTTLYRLCGNEAAEGNFCEGAVC